MKEEEEGRGEEGGRHGRLGCCSDCECSGSAAKRRWSGEMELPQEEEAAQRERGGEGEIPVSPFVLRTHRILACRQPSVEWRLEGGREREHVFFQGF